MKFKELPIGAEFKFASTLTNLTYTKVSPRKYRHPEVRTWVYRVGTTNVEVVKA
jgi:hypothetical protein